MTVVSRKWSVVRKSLVGMALCAVLFALCVSAEAQLAKKTPVIAVFLPETASVYASYDEAFRQGLRELGHVVGQTVLLEYRYTEGKRERLSELAAELVSLKVDVIVVTGGTLAVAKQATSVIPIVVATAGDLVGDGFIASLARPGGNITGSTNLDSDLSAKRLELLKESFPKTGRVAFLLWEANKQDEDELKETRDAAQRLAMRIQASKIKDPNQFQSVFTTITKERSNALIVTNNSFSFAHRKAIVEFAARNRLPTMFGRIGFVEDGGLMSYAASRHDSFRRAAYFVDRILKGANPGDLPVQQPTKFEFAINLKTAKQIGVTIPQSVLYRADKVIK